MRTPDEGMRSARNKGILMRDGRSGVQPDTPCINFWILILVLVGASIVITDGLTREPLPDEGTEAPLPVLEYQAPWAAYAFALVSLPICVLYASQAGSLAEGVLLWFVLCTVTYAKDFAYIRVPHTPVFVTDITLAILLYSLIKRFGVRWATPTRLWSKLLFAYVAVGCVCLLRGLSSEDKMLAVRDFALVLYVLFLFVGVYLVQTWNAVRRFFIMVLVGAALSTLNGVAWFAAQPGQRRFILFGIFILAAFIGVVVFTSHRLMPRLVGWPLAFLLGIGVLLANARTLYLALALALVVIFITPSSNKNSVPLSRVKLLGTVGLAVILLIVAVAQTSLGYAFLERTGSELVSGTFHYEDDPNGTFRILAWLEALQRFQAKPVVGEGYGIPFTFELDDSDPRPHNTYLTVLYKMGLAGFLPLCGFLTYVQWKGWKRWHAFKLNRESVLLYTMLITHLVVCAFGFLNLLLESPFLASIFWLSAGISLRMMYLSQTTPRNRLASAQ